MPISAEPEKWIRESRDSAVLSAMSAKIPQPWWGTASDLVALLGIGTVPPLSPRGLSDILQRLEAEDALEGWSVVRWRAGHGRSRMIGLLPPGWVWDGAARRWVVDGVPQDPAQPRA